MNFEYLLVMLVVHLLGRKSVPSNTDMIFDTLESSRVFVARIVDMKSQCAALCKYLTKLHTPKLYRAQFGARFDDVPSFYSVQWTELRSLSG